MQEGCIRQCFGEGCWVHQLSFRVLCRSLLVFSFLPLLHSIPYSSSIQNLQGHHHHLIFNYTTQVTLLSINIKFKKYYYIYIIFIFILLLIILLCYIPFLPKFVKCCLGLPFLVVEFFRLVLIVFEFSWGRPYFS